MNLVAVSGKIGSGKSTFCEFLAEALKEENQEVEIKNFADKKLRIKENNRIIFGRVLTVSNELPNIVYKSKNVKYSSFKTENNIRSFYLYIQRFRFSCSKNN